VPPGLSRWNWPSPSIPPSLRIPDAVSLKFFASLTPSVLSVSVVVVVICLLLAVVLFLVNCEAPYPVATPRIATNKKIIIF
jgi:hypothetical protein